MDLMLPYFSGTKDDFGKKVTQPFPLSFDRINEGQPFSTNFLSRLPLELVWHIVKLVDNEDLGSLALVNRDCRQLARSRQFATIKLDYSDSAIGILGILVNECEERSKNAGRTRVPSIGACVREINFATDPRWITNRHQIELSEEFRNLETGIRTARLDHACDAFFGVYMPNISLIFSNALVLPRLESLMWADQTPMNGTLLEAIVSLSLRYLVLQRVSIGEEVCFDVLRKHCRWRLETLQLDLASSPRKDIPTAPLVCGLLCLASPILKSLAWTSLDIGSTSFVQPPDLANDSPSFLRLKDVYIGDFTQYDPAWLDILVQPGGPSPIRFLEINICRNEVVSDFFRKCGYLPNLEIFVWRCIAFKVTSPSLDFLQANSHIRKLRIEGAMHGLLEEKLLPLLTRRFGNLNSLSVRWPEDQNYIPATALDQLSNLRNLEQLCLSAGCQAGWRHSWVIDHNAMLDCLRHLTSLRKIAFCRDTYTERIFNSQIEGDPEQYYEDRTLRRLDTMLARPYFQEGNIDEKLDRAWEMQHLHDMVKLAARYATILPELEWIYLGQRPIQIVRTPSGTTKCVPSSTVRDNCWTYLRKMFGNPNSPVE
jgi:hypothetical protein